jgi:integrase
MMKETALPRLTDYKKRLTQRKVNTIQCPRAGFKDYSDGMIKGLFLRASGSGRKRYFLAFRDNGQARSRKVGDHPSISLDQARLRAAKARESGEPWTYLGGDKEDRPTFGKLAVTYLARGLVHRSGPEEGRPLRSADKIERHVRGVLLPAWEHVVAADLSRADATKLLDRIGDERGPAAKRIAFQTINRILRFSVGRGALKSNPIEGLGVLGGKTKRTRVLDDDELARVWRASYEIEPAYGACVRTLMATGCRRAEVSELRWKDVAAKSFEITADRSKNGLAHTVPLVGLIKSEFDALPRDGIYCFSTTGGRKAINGFGKVKIKLDKISGLENWQIHDLRRSMRTGLSALNIPQEVCERVIGHKPTGLIEVYNRHAYSKEIAAALRKWSKHVAKITGPDCILRPPPFEIGCGGVIGE